MSESVDTFIYGKQDEPALRQELIFIANTFSCRPEMQEWIQFFSSAENIQGIQAAKAKYGIPRRNREATKSSGLFGKWTDYCDWFDIYKFYYYAKLSMAYPKLNPENKSLCYLLSGYTDTLEEENRLNEKNYTLSDDKEKYQIELEVYQEKIAEYKLLYSDMLCDEYKKQQEENKDKFLTQQKLDFSLKQQQEALKSTAGTSGGGTKLALYVFGGVAALIGIMLLARKSA
jgi:hypothetical protein